MPSPHSCQEFKSPIPCFCVSSLALLSLPRLRLDFAHQIDEILKTSRSMEQDV